VKRDDAIDYFLVPDRQLGIHGRLEDWARWVRVRPSGWQVAPMFRQYRSKSWQWHTPELRAAVNIPEAVAMEKAVSLLPEKHREAIRWCYVFGGGPVVMARRLAVTKEGLMELIHAGRCMLMNRSA
jgi:DNA-directed RNA polymerase specialized sigma24 family protein